MQRLRPWQHVAAALGLFVVSFLYLVFLSGYWFAWLGAWGLLCSELTFLALAVAAAALCRDRLAQVFPLRRPTLRQSLGALLLWVGNYPLVLVVAAVLMLLFPQQMAEAATGVQGIGVALPLWAHFLLMAVAPAVCEEALMRGFIQYHFGFLRHRWLRIAIVGALFGVLHLDMRFLVAALTGMVLCYAREESGNLFYSMLMHGANNALSVLATASLGAAAADADALAQEVAGLDISAVGVYCLLAAVSPWLLWAGSCLIRPKDAPPRRVPNRTAALGCALATAACLVLGTVLTLGGLAAATPALQGA